LYRFPRSAGTAAARGIPQDAGSQPLSPPSEGQDARAREKARPGGMLSPPSGEPARQRLRQGRERLMLASSSSRGGLAKAIALAACLIAAPALPSSAPAQGAPPARGDGNGDAGLPNRGPEVLPAKDAEFVAAVNQAVDRADDWLARQQQADGGWGVYHGNGDRAYVAGKTALALLARIAAGQNQYAEAMSRGYAHLFAHPPKFTYEVGLTLMAFDARAAPVGEWQQVERMTGAELAKYTFPRSVEQRDRDYLQPLVDRLAKERYHECWSYGNYGTGFAARGADMSNTQFAALGLRAGSRLGLEFDRKLFADLLDYVLDHQETKGASVKLIDVQEGKDGKPKEYARKVEARGFGYSYGTRDGAEIAGSRACIAIACIQLALEELLTKGKGDALARARKRRKEAVAAIHSQVAWLQEHFTVSQNPTGDGGNGFGVGLGGPGGGPVGPPGGGPGGGPPGGGPGGGPPAGGPGGAGGPPGGGPGGEPGRGFGDAPGEGAGFLYYYLYAMERVGALTDRKWIGRHDWYREGAEELIRRQAPDGSFPPASFGDDPHCNTCFALLFLKRATLRSSVTAGAQ
jgi:hypothetical protein